ncbi:DUF1749-domain-containing protein [Acephala macrosclerotiorum]|nr:DUF1749-domain-containing protein [Acephala macrosclerotiorum]
MATPRKGFVHNYTPRLTAFEHTPHSVYGTSQNVILFIGGLFDGLQTVPYVSKISDALSPTWTLAQVHLSSSYTGWGTASLRQDVKELSKCVSYFRGIKSGKIVLMGHSTGCQDVMEYLTGPGKETRPPIDAGIIQAPVSDREATLMSTSPEDYKSSCEAAKKMVDADEGNEILSSKLTNMPCPISAYRWLSLLSPNHDGDDDYFSSDLTDEQLTKTFGSLPAGVPLCILYSGSDEHVPQSIDKAALVRRWIEIAKKGKGVVDEGYSGVVKGATHNLAKDKEEVVLSLVGSVLGFLAGLSPQPNL